MARYTVHYQTVLESSMLIDAPDEGAAKDTVERWVRNGQHAAHPTAFEVVRIDEHVEDPEGDW